MSVRRLTLLPLMGAGILAVIATLHAQFPKVHVPKPPAVPGVATPPTPVPAPATRRAGDTWLQVLPNQRGPDQQVLEGAGGEEEGLRRRDGQSRRGDGESRAKQAEADALAKKRAANTMNTMMANAECKDAFKEKDPRSKEIARLEALVADADDKGDQAKSDQIRKRLDPLNARSESTLTARAAARAPPRCTIAWRRRRPHSPGRASASRC